MGGYSNEQQCNDYIVSREIRRTYISDLVKADVEHPLDQQVRPNPSKKKRRSPLLQLHMASSK